MEYKTNKPSELGKRADISKLKQQPQQVLSPKISSSSNTKIKSRY
jgi:hypothetical protein